MSFEYDIMRHTLNKITELSEKMRVHNSKHLYNMQQTTTFLKYKIAHIVVLEIEYSPAIQTQRV